MKLNKQLLSSKNQTWATPLSIFNPINEIFDFVLDPCAAHETAKCKIYYTEKENGLKQDWSKIGNAYVNPPFGRELPKWMKKCYEESIKGITVVMLIPARVDTRYWHDYAFKYARCICFVKGRITFERFGSKTPKEEWVPAPFPNAIVVFGECNSNQAEQLNKFGKVYMQEAQAKAQAKAEVKA